MSDFEVLPVGTQRVLQQALQALVSGTAAEREAAIAAIRQVLGVLGVRG